MHAAHENLLSVREVERDFRIPARTQRHWRTHNPAFRATALKLGGKRVLYDRKALELWLESQRETRVQK